MILLSDLIKQYESLFYQKYSASILPGHVKTLNAMKLCRTLQAKRMLAVCSNKDCAQHAFIPHSCGQRNCPHCQHHEGCQWIENQLKKQLPATYYLITFTLPKELRELAYKNQKDVYSIMFKNIKEVLKSFCLHDKKLKGEPGMTMVLHTHSRRLDFHPHIHVLIPGGCIDTKARLWRVKSGEYLFNHKALAKVFRAKMLKDLNEAGLALPEKYPAKWVVDCKNVGRGDKVILYLGKYLYKGVVQEKDIIKNENGMVTFRYVDSKTKKTQTRTVSGEYFLWLLMQHVLPKGFRRVRSYGFLHPCSKQLVSLLKYLLGVKPSAMLKKLRERPRILCKCCQAAMNIIHTMLPPAFARHSPALV